MGKLVALFLLFWVFILPNNSYAAREATADLAEDFIPITEDFDGATMTVFGALRSPESNVVVVIEGPAIKALVRAKVRRYGVWVNDEPQTISPAPSFYAVLSSRPVAKITDDKTIQKLGLTLAALTMNGLAGEGLKRDRKDKGLYLERDDGARIRDKKLFRADVRLPPNVPVGTYRASVYELSGGKVVASRTTSFSVAQIGIGGSIKHLALKRPVLYAMMALVFALGIGGGAAHLFRKVS